MGTIFFLAGAGVAVLSIFALFVIGVVAGAGWNMSKSLLRKRERDE